MGWFLQTVGGLALGRDDEMVLAPLQGLRNKGVLLLFLLAWSRGGYSRRELALLLWPLSSSDSAQASLRTELSSLRLALSKTLPDSENILSEFSSGENNRVRLRHIVCDSSLIRKQVRGQPLSAMEEERLVPLRSASGFLPRFPGRRWWDELATVTRLVDDWDGEIARWRRSAASTLSESLSDRIDAPFPPIGRERTLRRLARLLAPAGAWVTLVGPPGVGKTRLARELAGRPDCAAFIDVTDATGASDFLFGLGQALGTNPTETGPRAIAELRRRLGDRFLVVDNVETVLARDPAGVHDAIVALCDVGARFVLTSRAALKHPGEIAFVVTPLSVPDLDAPREQIAASESVHLFVRCVRRRDPTFQIGARNAAAVGRVCRALDGLPLALELAAMRLGTITMRKLLEEIETGNFLQIRVRDGRSAGHRSLEIAFSGSLAQCSDTQAETFSTLGTLAGAFDTNLAASVLDRPVTEAETILNALRDRSLLVRMADDNDVPPADFRWRLLEPIREFARARAAERPDDGAQRRYADAMARRVEILPIFPTAGHMASVDRDWPHIVWIFRTIVGDERNRERVVRLLLVLRFYIASRPHRIEDCVGWLPPEQITAAIDTSPITTASRAILAELLLLRDRYDEADRAAQAALSPTISGEFDDLARFTAASARCTRAYIAQQRGSHADGYRLATEALAIGDPLTERVARQRQASILIDLGDWDRAIACLEVAIDRSRVAGDIRGQAHLLRSLASAQAHSGACGASVETYLRALPLADALEDMTMHQSLLTHGAEASLLAGDIERGMTLLEELERLRERQALSVPMEAMYWKVQSLRYRSQGELALARDALERARPLFAVVGQRQQIREIDEIVARLSAPEEIP